jgi:hypothetical protein
MSKRLRARVSDVEHFCSQNFIFCWPSISSQILVHTQPDALFRVFIYSFNLSTCFERQVLIIRRSNCINTSSGVISLCKWLLGMPLRREPPYRHTKQSLTQTNNTWWCINTIRSPDDEHLTLETCREMKWINKYMKKSIRLVINKKYGYVWHMKGKVALGLGSMSCDSGV